jgi:hypothetical protein
VFWWESLKEEQHSEHRGVYGRMASEGILNRLDGGRVWSGFSWLVGRDRWHVLVNTVMNLRVLAPRI